MKGNREKRRRYRQMIRWRSLACGYKPPTGKGSVGAALQPYHNAKREDDLNSWF